MIYCDTCARETKPAKPLGTTEGYRMVYKITFSKLKAWDRISWNYLLSKICSSVFVLSFFIEVYKEKSVFNFGNEFIITMNVILLTHILFISDAQEVRIGRLEKERG